MDSNTRGGLSRGLVVAEYIRARRAMEYALELLRAPAPAGPVSAAAAAAAVVSASKSLRTARARMIAAGIPIPRNTGARRLRLVGGPE